MGSSMAGWFEKYNNAVRLEHGWTVKLICGKCGHEGLPKYIGWTPSAKMNFGSNPTIYADISCAKCGNDLKDEAGIKLVDLFSDVSVSQKNKKLIALFILYVLCVLLFVMGISSLFFGWRGLGCRSHISGFYHSCHILF